ncbi:putative TPR repeat methyltransferase [Plasticicumulans lactativorans]|uniref:Putative TPR repeat methyltransferase n=1 Tax=Plasticicumulans lactativorans TaxID=1133106 RepID=A0A4R2LFQ3_9GAMM|nr:tetratricopeptide repeat protein [Plasticicumulans lactativorans]TCO78095.1 putative TPR repeat methyltransferase [Plasticicumulans lactativorans]
MPVDEDEVERRLTPAQALELAVGWQRAGELDAAESIYRQVLAQCPGHVDALHFLGLLRFQRGDGDGALAVLRAAARLAPGHADLRSNLGNVLQALGQPEAAESEYRAALDAAPEHVAAWNNLGVVLRAQGREREAVAAYRRALELEARSADDHYNLASLLERSREWDAALAEYRRALALEPRHLGTLRALGHVLSKLERFTEAAQAYAAWLEREPGHPLAQARLAACGGAPAPARCDDAYVRGLFDSYAEHFDAHLCGRLGYDVPKRLAEALGGVLGAPQAALEVLDAGCGTGLCGPLLKPWARRLVGVDLSGGMLEKARARGVYDELEQAELTAFLGAAQAGAYDVIASADTLCYFGELGAVTRAARGALRPGGWFGFTVERTDEALAGGYRINPHGRYSHAADYVRAVLCDAGFEAAELTPTVLRVERGRPVAGWLVRARVPGAV